MTIIIVLVLAAVGLVAYCHAGFRLAARPYVAREVQRYCEDFPSLAENPRDMARWRRSAVGESVFLIPVWPIVLAFRTLTARMDAATPLSPHELQQQIAERDRRIAKLERDLGIGGRP